MTDLDKSARHLDENQGRGVPRNEIEELMLAARQKSDQEFLVIAAVVLVFVILAFVGALRT